MALYGHPDAGGDWEKHCDAMLKEVGFKALRENWPSMCYNAELDASLMVYVDDFKMAAPKANSKSVGADQIEDQTRR